MTAPLLYVCVRPQRAAAVAEWASFRDGLGVGDDDLVHHDLVREPLPLDLERYAAVVVGGSPFNVTDPDKTDEQQRLERDLERLAATAIEGRTHALFTCFGIGVVTRLLGGTVTLQHPEGTGPADISLTDAGREDELFGILNPRFEALTAHKEGADAVPPGATLLAENDACPVQAYRAGAGLWATQFHPEPTTDAFVARMRVYRDAGYFDAEAFDEVSAHVRSASVEQPTRLLRSFAARAVAA
ncbi:MULTISPECIES: GMP synthase [Microbacterium]|uniref:glutamine amidotransferase-related protein n=1 Tax=Microbacterium TaxID=33882 RepID=UPI00277FCD0A|nr:MULTISPECIES: GMP synthase [Microbacterium]MDQ1082867.1 GMP synthase (glutamine-hydrolyzing) [Microbacterium sp. SORGH_AS_0344]MDQ1168364.1 GMP synthase (glutamine-hydrolyzing) [Microbacterium proteolyticum]